MLDVILAFVSGAVAGATLIARADARLVSKRVERTVRKAEEAHRRAAELYQRAEDTNRKAAAALRAARSVRGWSPTPTVRAFGVVDNVEKRKEDN